MRRHHPKNERVKRQYFTFLEDAKRMSPSSLDHVAAALALFEASTGYRDFRKFHIEQARKFKRDLLNYLNPGTGKPLAKSTTHSRLMALKAFFVWLAGQPGYKSRLTYSDAEYFNLSNNDTRIQGGTGAPHSHARADWPCAHFDTSSDRDRTPGSGIDAFTLLSGARDNAIASFSLKHVDLTRRTVFQDARQVRTKNAKTFTSTFFPVGHDVEAIVSRWVAFLKDEKLFGPDDPLFPATKVGLDENGLFQNAGLARKHWRDAGAIRKIFREAFQAANLPYFNPHSFRKTLALLGQKCCPTPEALKAWSQNLGHEQVLTTLTSYGAVSGHRQAEILNELAVGHSAVPVRFDGAQLVVVDAGRLAKIERILEDLGTK
jgi:integrase